MFNWDFAGIFRVKIGRKKQVSLYIAVYDQLVDDIDDKSIAQGC